jgi:hypothetical protein
MLRVFIEDTPNDKILTLFLRIFIRGLDILFRPVLIILHGMVMFKGCLVRILLEIEVLLGGLLLEEGEY